MMGIIDRIKAAKTSGELKELVAELGSYEQASGRTVKRARRIAAQKQKELAR